jgi:hypothetical protein
MRQFLVSGRTQNVVNLVAGSYTLLGIMVLFISGNLAPLWIGVSTLVSLVTWLAYNMWVDAELSRKRRERTF